MLVEMPRAALAAVLFAAAALAPSSAAAAPPSVTLLTPANGAKIATSAASPAYPTFSWHVDWASAEEAMIVWQVAADAGFTRDASTESQYCPASNPNCWTSVKPQRAWGPPAG